MKMKDIHIERKTSQEKEDGRNKQRREPLYQSKKELGTSAIRHNIFFHCVGLVSKKAGLTSGREVNFGILFVFFWIFFRFLGFPCVFLLFLVFSLHVARFSCEF